MRPLSFLVLVLVCCLECIRAVDSNTVKIEDEDVGEPLILTSYLTKGLLEEARKKSLVQHYEVPGIESYSGYFTVDKRYNTNLFFWYFPAENNRETAPLIWWMTGGPGSTSLLGLFAENGPFTVTVNQTVEMRNSSWTRNHHMLYLDSPADAGFSFMDDSRGYARTSADVARNAVAFLIQFYELFPQLRNNELYVVGESLGGKFAPPIVHDIKVHNEKAEDKINLQGLVIAGGVADPVNQLKHVQYLYELGLLDGDQRVELQALEDKVVDSLAKKKTILSLAMLFKLIAKFKEVTGFDYYFHSMRPHQPEYINPFVDWVVRPDVRKAIHVGNTNFERHSVKVKMHIIRDMLFSVANYIEEILEDNKRVLIYTGQLDMMVTNAAMEKYTSKLKWFGAEDYKKAAKKLYYVGEELAGYVKSAKNLTSVLIRDAGHMLPNDKPVWAFDMITRFTHKQGY